MKLRFRNVIENSPPAHGTSGPWNWYCAEIVPSDPDEASDAFKVASITKLTQDARYGVTWQIHWATDRVVDRGNGRVGRYSNCDSLAEAKEDVEAELFEQLWRQFGGGES